MDNSSYLIQIFFITGSFSPFKASSPGLELTPHSQCRIGPAQHKLLPCSVPKPQASGLHFSKDPRPPAAREPRRSRCQACLCSLPSPTAGRQAGECCSRVKPGAPDTVNTPDARRSLSGQPGRPPFSKCTVQNLSNSSCRWSRHEQIRDLQLSHSRERLLLALQREQMAQSKLETR